MKSAYRSVSFYIGQRDLEMQYKMNKLVAQCRQKCEVMQEKCREKLEQVYTAYQKMTKRCQMLEQERESLSKDKQELQDKFAEKCRLIDVLIYLNVLIFLYCVYSKCTGSSNLETLTTSPSLQAEEETWRNVWSGKNGSWVIEAISNPAFEPLLLYARTWFVLQSRDWNGQQRVH